jgi:sugar phosphate permease
VRKKLNIKDATAGVLAGFVLFWISDRLFGLTAGAFHHIFGTGILFSYLLVSSLLEILHPSGQTVGIPVAPFMMIFFITVPEVSLLGGYVGEVVRRRKALKTGRNDRPKTRGPQRVS